MKYKIVDGLSYDLQEKVRLLLADGWRPLGSPFPAMDGRFYQALIKDE